MQVVLNALGADKLAAQSLRLIQFGACLGGGEVDKSSTSMPFVDPLARIQIKFAADESSRIPVFVFF
jgi:hypothetical protein